uniref:Uncharacterized protein n=1 Tax=Panagrolaimus davidi TaxID=227884 RepID=A0A914QCA8_9BILA
MEVKERKKGGRKDKNDSSRRQLKTANFGRPLGRGANPPSKTKNLDGTERRHVRQTPVTVPAEPSPPGAALNVYISLLTKQISFQLLKSATQFY